MNALKNIKQTLTITAVIAAFLFAGCDNPVNDSNNVDTTNDLTSEAPAYGEMNKKNGKSKVENSYIVVLKKNSNASENAKNAERATGGKIGHVYNNALKGYSLQLPPQASSRALEALKNNPNVDFIEEDKEVSANGTQTNATWGLDRIDQQNLPLDDLYVYENTAENVTAYILDTGINYSHSDFSGRASFGFDAYGGNGADCDGHGTHVAGTVGGDTWGVAKDVNLVAVRVLDCNGNGTLSGVIAGIDWVTQNASGPSVANMSLGGGFSSSLNTAVRNSVSAGITYSVSAGNSNADACNYSPASTSEAITVGSTSSNDARSSFSNYGSCVDIFAPGSGITSAWIGNNSATSTISGTSMSAPHVAGAAALYLQNNASATPAEVYSALFENSTKNKVTNSNTDNNHLLYTIFGSGDGGSDPDPEPEPNVAPSADFTYSTSDLSVDFTSTSTDSDGSIASYSWDFGDGNTSSSANPSHTYNSEGTYSVSLTVTDNDSDSDTATKSVQVTAPVEEPNTPPSADFTFTANDLNVDFTSTSTDNDGSITSYSWSFGDGNTSSSANPSHTYNSEGTYSVSLTVTDNDGDSDTATKSVQVTAPVEEPNTPPSADFTFSANDLSVSFTNQSTDSDGSIASYSWSFGDGSTSSNANPSHTYNAEGSYSVSLTVTDNDGDSDTITKSVQVTAPVVNPDNPPVVSSLNVSTRNTGPWSRAEINWAVSDVDGDLASVRIELLSGSRVVDSATIGVSGSSGSGLTELRNRGSVSSVRVTVTDASGNSTTQTENL